LVVNPDADHPCQTEDEEDAAENNDHKGDDAFY
jgi:hypothetical protein